MVSDIQTWKSVSIAKLIFCLRSIFDWAIPAPTGRIQRWYIPWAVNPCIFHMQCRKERGNDVPCNLKSRIIVARQRVCPTRASTKQNHSTRNSVSALRYLWIPVWFDAHYCSGERMDSRLGRYGKNGISVCLEHRLNKCISCGGLEGTPKSVGKRILEKGRSFKQSLACRVAQPEYFATVHWIWPILVAATGSKDCCSGNIKERQKDQCNSRYRSLSILRSRWWPSAGHRHHHFGQRPWVERYRCFPTVWRWVSAQSDTERLQGYRAAHSRG